MAFRYAGQYGPFRADDHDGRPLGDGELIGIYDKGTHNFADVYADRFRAPGANPVAVEGGNLLFRAEVDDYDSCRIIHGVPQYSHMVTLTVTPDPFEADEDIADVETTADDQAASLAAAATSLAGVRLLAPNPFLELMILFIIGASYEANDFQNTNNARAVLRFANRNRMQVTNNALAGSMVDSAVVRALGNKVTKYTSGFKGLVWEDVLHNTVLSAGFTTDRQKDHLLSNLRALLACVGSMDRIEASTLTPTGTWTTDTQTTWSAGSAMTTTEANARLDGTITFPASGHVDVIVASVDAASPTGIAFPPSAFSVNVDGVQAWAGTAADHTLNTASTVENDGVGRLAVPLDATPGDHPFRILKDATAGTSLFVDCILRRSSNPPPQLFWLMNPVDYAAVAAGYHRTTTQAEVDAANAAAAALCAEFANVHVMDRSWWDPASMLGADGIHPRDPASIAEANAAQTRVNELIVAFDRGLHMVA